MHFRYGTQRIWVIFDVETLCILASFYDTTICHESFQGHVLSMKPINHNSEKYGIMVLRYLVSNQLAH